MVLSLGYLLFCSEINKHDTVEGYHLISSSIARNICAIVFDFRAHGSFIFVPQLNSMLLISCCSG